MQSLSTLLLLNELVPFCNTADTLALCSVVRRLAPEPIRYDAFYRALRGMCPATWDLDEYAADPLCSDDDATATERRRLVRLHRALTAFHALEPFPGAWTLPSWCPRPRRLADIVSDLVSYAYGVARDDDEPFEGRGPLALGPEAAAHIVSSALSYALGDDDYPSDLSDTMNLVFNSSRAIGRAYEQATFAWIAALPGRLHALLPRGAPRVLRKDPVTVVAYTVWTDYLDYILDHPESWSGHMAEGLALHRTFLTEASRRMTLACRRFQDWDGIRRPTMKWEVDTDEISAIELDIAKVRDTALDQLDVLNERYADTYIALEGVDGLFAEAAAE